MKLTLKNISLALLLVLGTSLSGIGPENAVNASTVQNIYIDSNAPAGGNGSLSTPYKTFSSLNWTTIGNWVTAGDSVFINLKRDSVFRETLTMGKSGTVGNPIVVQDYGQGEKPIIKGSNVFAGTWTVYSGETYQIAAPAEVFYLWKNGVYYNRGSDPNTLSDKKWHWANGILYLNISEGNPDITSSLVEGSVRANGIYMSAKNNITISNIVFFHTNTKGSSSFGIFVNSSGQNISIIGCEFREANGVGLNSATNFLIQNSYFGISRYATGAQLQISGASTTGTIAYSLFVESTAFNKIKITAGSVNIYNSLFDTYSDIPILSTTAGTVNVKNSIFSGASYGLSKNQAIKHTGTGTFTLANSLVLPSGLHNVVSSSYLIGVIDGGGNMYREPKWVKTAREGIYSFIIDDTVNAKIWSNLSTVADQFGYKIGLGFNSYSFLMGSDNYDANTLQDAINRGHYLANHGSSHSNIAATIPFTISYVGTGTAALLTIASSTFVTNVADAPQDSLTLDLNHINYDRVSELCAYVITKNYTCTQSDAQQLNKILTRTLLDITDIDIKTAPYDVHLDIPKYLTSELNDNHDLVASTFTEADGVTPYQMNTFVYPFGAGAEDPDNSPHKNWLYDMGYIAARGVQGPAAQKPNWLMQDGIELYRTRISPGATSKFSGLLSVLLFKNDLNDGNTANPKNFTNVGNKITFTNTIYDPLINTPRYSGVFNGTNAYATRAYDADFNFSRGDGYISVSVRPNTLTTKQTIYFQGNDANNYHTFYISNTGSLVYSIVSGGVETLHVESATGLLSTNSFARIALIFYEGTYRIIVDNVEVASVASNVKPLAYTGLNYVGAGYDYANSQVADLYNGYMGVFSLGREIFMRFTATLSSIGSNGGFVSIYSHEEGEKPPAMYRIMFEAAQKYTGRVQVLPYPEAVNYFKTHGEVLNNGRVAKWIQASEADYHLRSTSPGVDTGADVGFATDYDGNPIVGAPDIGPFEYQAP